MSRKTRHKRPLVSATSDIPAPLAVASTSTTWPWRRAIYPASSDTGTYAWKPQVDKDLTSLMPQYRQRLMLSDARTIYASGGMVSGACHKKADYVVGCAWHPAYLGTDEKYKKAVTPLINDWVKRCEMRGGPFIFSKVLHDFSVCLDRDGDVFAVLTYDETGYPKIQVLEAHRIGSPSSDEVLNDGPYAGRMIHGGVVYDDYMRPLAYNLLPPNFTYKSWDKTPPNFLPAASVVHIWDPKWFSSTRGIPTLCHGILDWYAISEIREAEKVAVLVNSKLSLIETNETGRVDLTKSNFGGNQNTAGQDNPHVETLENGLIRYIKATGKIESHTSDRPGQTWQGFMDHIARGAFMGMDLPIEFAWDMSSLSAGAMRGVVGQVKRSVENRQNALETPAMSILMHPISTWIKQGKCPMAEDWMNFGFSYPPSYSVDVGRDGLNRREDLKVGTRTLTDCVTEDGGNVEAHLITRAKDYKLAMEIAKREGVPLGAVYDPSATFGDEKLLSIEQDVDEDEPPARKGSR